MLLVSWSLHNRIDSCRQAAFDKIDATPSYHTLLPFAYISYTNETLILISYPDPLQETLQPLQFLIQTQNADKIS